VPEALFGKTAAGHATNSRMFCLIFKVSEYPSKRPQLACPKKHRDGDQMESFAEVAFN
jgi:hypothetical protein